MKGRLVVAVAAAVVTCSACAAAFAASPGSRSQKQPFNPSAPPPVAKTGAPFSPLPVLRGFQALVLCSDGTLEKVDLSNGRIIAQLSTNTLPPQNPHALAISTRLNLGVALSLVPGQSYAIALFRLTPLSLITSVSVPFPPVSAAIDPLTNELLVTGGDGALYFLSLPGLQVLRKVQLSTSPDAYLDGIALSSDGTTAAVIEDGDTQAGNYLFGVSTESGAIEARVLVTTDPGAYLDDVAMDRRYPIAWVTDGGYGEGFLFGIDLTTGSIVQTTPVGGGPLALAISYDDQTAYVVNGGTGQGDLVVPVDISAQDRAVQHTGGTPYQVGTGQIRYLDAIALVPGQPLAVLTDRTTDQLLILNLVSGLPSQPITVGQGPVALSLLTSSPAG